MPDMSPHVSTVFKELFDELKSMKQQQWTITNYGVLILAAIYAARDNFEGEIVLLLAILTAVIGSVLLLLIQSHMVRSRCRLDKLHKTYFKPDELRDIGLTNDEINNLGDETWWYYFRQWWRGWEVLFALIVVLWLGFVLLVGSVSDIVI